MPRFTAWSAASLICAMYGLKVPGDDSKRGMGKEIE